MKLSNFRKARKKPVEIEYVQFTGHNFFEIQEFVGHSLKYSDVPDAVLYDKDDIPVTAYTISIPTLEGVMKASQYDYIIKGVANEFYPCKPDIFEKTYDIIEVEDEG